MKCLVKIGIKRGGKWNCLPSRNFNQPRENFPHIHFGVFLTKSVCVIERSIFSAKGSKVYLRILQYSMCFFREIPSNQKEMQKGGEQFEESHWVIPVPFLSPSSKLVGSLLVCQPLKQKQQEETFVLWSFLFFQTSCQAMKREEGKQKQITRAKIAYQIRTMLVSAIGKPVLFSPLFEDITALLPPSNEMSP